LCFELTRNVSAILPSLSSAVISEKFSFWNQAASRSYIGLSIVFFFSSQVSQKITANHKFLQAS
jgi:hypothetical protein